MLSNLEAEMARNNLRQIDLAVSVGVSPKTIFNKMSGKTEFTAKEMRVIQGMLPRSKELTLDYLFAVSEERESV